MATANAKPATILAAPRGNALADGEQLWAVIEGHEIDGEVIAEGLSRERALLFAASEELLAACIRTAKDLRARGLVPLALERAIDKATGPIPWNATPEEIERAIAKATGE